MSERFLDKASRILAWGIFGFGLLCMALGVIFWWGGRSMDIGGIVGGLLFFAGIYIAIESLGYVRRKKS